MISRHTRQRLLQIVFWSPPGRKLIKFADYIAPRWNHVVKNRSLNAAVNGEYWLISLLPEEAFLIDVGFNKGDFSSEFALRIPKGKVIGFDPAKSMRLRYESTYKYKTRVELVSAAVSNHNGYLLFTDTDDGVSHIGTRHAEKAPQPNEYEVPVITLDEFASERKIQKIDFLKIDAEGFDLHVLEGASSLLHRSAIDIFMFEFNEPWIRSRRFLHEAYEFIIERDYRLFSLFNGFLVPLVYTHRAERHDLGCNYVGISKARLARGDVRIKEFP
jgi:FkbM family methyltransferase